LRRKELRELVALVGGSGNVNGALSAKALRRVGAHSEPGPGVAHSPDPGTRKALPAPVRKGSRKGKEGAIHEPQKTRPDQVIPLEEGNFKEF
jgi:hypothetical protein